MRAYDLFDANFCNGTSGWEKGVVEGANKVNFAIFTELKA